MAQGLPFLEHGLGEGTLQNLPLPAQTFSMGEALGLLDVCPGLDVFTIIRRTARTTSN